MFPSMFQFQSFIQDFVYNNFKRIISRHFKPYDMWRHVIVPNVFGYWNEKHISNFPMTKKEEKKNSTHIIKPQSHIVSKSPLVIIYGICDASKEKLSENNRWLGQYIRYVCERFLQNIYKLKRHIYILGRSIVYITLYKYNKTSLRM